MKALLTVVLFFMVVVPAWAEADPLASAATLGLRVGMNVPTSTLSSGVLPDIDIGYRHKMDGFAIEPALGWQTWRGNVAGTGSSSQLVNGQGDFEQAVSATVFEARVRGWYDLGDSGALLGALHAGSMQASTRQESFGQVWEEEGGNVTLALYLGYAYPIAEAYGSAQALVGYRHAPADFLTTGSANLSGFQLLIGWQVAYPF